jgi:hypothetical protein
VLIMKAATSRAVPRNTVMKTPRNDMPTSTFEDPCEIESDLTSRDTDGP